MRENLSQGREMLGPDVIASEMAAIVRLAAEPVAPGETVGELIRRAARRVGLSYGRVKKYWYREITRPPAHEYVLMQQRKLALMQERRARLHAEMCDLKAALGKMEQE